MKNAPVDIVKTKIRRSWLGNRYDIYVNDQYRVTAYSASEIEELIQKLNLNEA